MSYTVKDADGNVISLPDGISIEKSTVANQWNLKGSSLQAGVYTIKLKAEDIYGNVSDEKVITLTITQRPTTDSIESITQNYNADQGNVSLTVKGLTGATIKLYSENAGTFTEIDILDESEIAEANGTLNITISQANAKRFNGGKVYVTQKMANKLESGKTDYTEETISRKDNKKTATGGAIVIDNKPPTPLQIIQPLAGTNILKITNLSADENVSDVKDIDKIILMAGADSYTLERQYDEQGESTGKWKCNNNREFTETNEQITVVVNPNTGETKEIEVGVLNFELPENVTFEQFQVVTATYYDYLGNGSATVATSVPKLPEPIAPYNMTAINNSKDHPEKTVITGKADVGAVLSVTIGGQPLIIDGQPYEVSVNELGEFTMEIPKQDAGTEITVTSKLNGYTKDGTVTVKNVQADDYKPEVIDVAKVYGQATTEAEVLGAVCVPGYPEGEEQPVVTLGEGAVLPDGNTAGTYNVPILVTYPDGTTDTATVKVKVNAPPVNETPTINKPKAGDTSVSGTAEPGAKIKVELPNGKTKETTADGEGNWKVVTDQPLEAGQEVGAIAITAGKEPSDKATTTVGQGPVAQTASPTIIKPKAGDAIIKGTAEPGSEVVVTLPFPEPNNTKTTTADENGNWTVATGQPLVEGQEVGATATKEGKDPSDKATTIVGSAPVLQTASPTINKPVAGDTSVSGTAEPGATVTVKLPNGIIKTVTADSVTGAWQVTTVQLQLNDTIEATATATGKDPSNKVTETVGSVPIIPEQTASPTINKPVAGDTSVSGTAEPGATVVVTLPDGTTKEPTAEADGSWTVDIEPSVLEEGEKVKATAKTEDKTISNEVTETVQSTTSTYEQTASPTINKPVAGDEIVSGTAEAGATVDVKLPNGTTETVTANIDTGAWQVTTDPLQANDTIEATATATSKDPSNKVTETVGSIPTAPEQTASPTINKPVTGDTSVSGTAEPGATVDVKLPNGTTETVIANIDTGAWQVTTDPLQANDTIEATATATSKDPSNKVTETVGSIPTAPEQTANPVITKPKAGDTSVSGTAEPGATVVVTLPDGTTRKTVADADGNWKVVFAKPLEEGQKVGAIVTANNKDPSNTVITTVGSAQLGQTTNPRITKPKAGDTSVSGTAEPGATVVVTLPDGTTKEITADANGNWKVVFAKPLEEGQEVGVIATKEGKDSSNKVITTVGPADPAPVEQTANPTINKPVAGDTSVSGTAEPGAKVVVELPDGTTKETIADADGKWTVASNQPLAEGQVIVVTATTDGKAPSDKVITTVGPKDPTQTVDPTDPTQTDHTDPTQPKPTDPTQPEPKDPGTLGKVIPVGSDIDSPIPENYIRLYFDPTGNGWLKYNPTFDTGTVIAFDALKNITWADALANGLIVPTATHNDPALTFDKWSLTMSEDTVIDNTTYRYYYFVAAYKPVESTEKDTTPAGTTVPAKDGTNPPVVKTGESTMSVIAMLILISLGVVLIIVRRKIRQDRRIN